MHSPHKGAMAEWLCSGLQSRVPRFDSGFRLQTLACAKRPGGEIGRHSGLKIRRLPERGRTGSIPVPGTTDLET